MIIKNCRFSILFILSITSCSSADKIVGAKPPICINVETDDLFFSRTADKNYGNAIKKRSEKYLAESLQNEKFTSNNTEKCGAKDYKLSVSVLSVEEISEGKYNPFVIGGKTRSRLTYKIRYEVEFLSDLNAKIFKFKDDKDDDSLDELLEKMASQAASKVNRKFKG